jgi:hypothetical protein
LYRYAESGIGGGGMGEVSDISQLPEVGPLYKSNPVKSSPPIASKRLASTLEPAP